MAGLIDTLPFIVLIFTWDVYQEEAAAKFYIQTALMGLTWHVYSIFMNVKYGGTLGKMAAGIRVIKNDESGTMSLPQAIIRDSVWIASYAIGMTLMTVKFIHGESLDPSKYNIWEETLNWTGTAWFLLEITTALFSDRRRAIHDWMAGTVVVRNECCAQSPPENIARTIGKGDRHRMRCIDGRNLWFICQPDHQK